MVEFRGKTAHAAFDPWNGRSASDATEAFVNGVNQLREHVRPSVRMHYVVQRAGDVPNVVPDYAKVGCGCGTPGERDRAGVARAADRRGSRLTPESSPSHHSGGDSRSGQSRRGPPSIRPEVAGNDTYTAEERSSPAPFSGGGIEESGVVGLVQSIAIRRLGAEGGATVSATWLAVPTITDRDDGVWQSPGTPGRCGNRGDSMATRAWSPPTGARDHCGGSSWIRRYGTRCGPNSPSRPGVRLQADSGGPAAGSVTQQTAAFLNLHEVERMAREILPAPTYDYYAGGANDEITLQANRRAFEEIAIRHRVLVDVSRRDLTVSLLGAPSPAPLIVAPMPSRVAHPDGELATARPPRHSD